MKSPLLSKIIPAVLAGLVLTSCASGPKKVAHGPFEVVLPGKTSSIKRVAITNFFVQYVTDQGVEANAAGRDKASNTFYSKVQGVSPELMQSTSNALYDELVAEFKKVGIEAVNKSDLDSNAEFREIRDVSKKSPYLVNDSTIKKMSTLVSAYGLPIYFSMVQDIKLSATYNSAREESNIKILRQEENEAKWLLGEGMSTEARNLSTIFGGQMKISKAFNATTLSVRLTVPLVDMGIRTKGSITGGFFGAGKHVGFAKANARFVEGGTIFQFTNLEPGTGEVGYMALLKPIGIPNLKVDVVEGNGPRDGGGLVGALFGAGGINTDKADLFVNVDPATFQQELVAAGSAMLSDVALAISNPPK